MDDSDYVTAIELMEKAVALPIDQKKLVDRANFFAVENQSTELIHLLNHL